MKFNTMREEKLEELPKFEKTAKSDIWEYRSNFPYKRTMNWIEGNVGKNIDGIAHRFVNLYWLPVEYRNLGTLFRYVQNNTFLENGEVHYFDDTPCRQQHSYKVSDQSCRVYYVHPVSKALEVWRPLKRESFLSRNKREQAKYLRVLAPYHQLVKKDGIWYEVKAQIIEDLKFTDGVFMNNFYYLYPLKGPEDNLLEDRKRRTDKNCNHTKIVLKRQLSSKELRRYGLVNCK